MTLNDTMTALMNKARKLTGLTDKIGIARLTDLMDHFDLHVNPNLLSYSSFTILAAKKTDSWRAWDANTLDFTFEKGQTYTFSWQAKAEAAPTGSKVRILLLDPNNNVSYPVDSGGIEFSLTDNRQSCTFTIPNDKNNYKLHTYGSGYLVPEYWNVTFYNCKLEVGNLATPFEKLGGVIKALLYALYPVRGCAA